MAVLQNHAVRDRSCACVEGRKSSFQLHWNQELLHYFQENVNRDYSPILVDVTIFCRFRACIKTFGQKQLKCLVFRDELRPAQDCKRAQFFSEGNFCAVPYVLIFATSFFCRPFRLNELSTGTACNYSANTGPGYNWLLWDTFFLRAQADTPKAVLRPSTK